MTNNTFAQFDDAVYSGSGNASLPFAQIINSEGAIGIALDQAELVNFEPDDNWKLTDVKIKGKGKIQFYTTQSPRFHIIRRRSWDTGEEKNGRKIINNYMLLVFVDDENNPLHDGVMQLKLKGLSVASASFYGEVYNLKNEDAWLKQLWNVKPRANGRFQALTVTEMTTDIKMMGTGSASNECCRFTGHTELTESNMASGEMFVGFDSERKNHIESLYDEYADYGKRKQVAEDELESEIDNKFTDPTWEEYKNEDVAEVF